MAERTLQDVLEPLIKEHGWECFEDAEGNYNMEIPLPKGRRQKVLVRLRTDAYQNQQIQVLSFVCRASQCDLKELLMKNIALSYGALGIEKEVVYMVDTLLLETADREELISSLRHVAATADTLEQEFSGHDLA